eukprot:TRINITY_DN62041_c0_g1_i1.p1 TRINITY_DN62041_c0_g1~~TRINITY_DN62041_c0_g1_i1.p1  ORF type:complete len:278 (-),score=44.28 TRINITY_DN62041_c0_g1_i1:167-1000(-)
MGGGSEGNQHFEQIRSSGALDVRRPVCILASADVAERAATDGGLAVNEKRIHFVRHGQGFHNLMADIYKSAGRKFDSATGEGGSDNPYCHPAVLDAPLTEIGREQARCLRPRARALQPQPELVVVSPMVRATQTALIAFDHLLGATGRSPSLRVPFVAHESCREIMGIHVCDRRRRLSDVRPEFTFVDYDEVGISEEDSLWNADVRETQTELADRAYSFMLWIRSRPESEIVVATHSAFLFSLFNVVLVCEDKGLTSWFQTGEMRSIVVAFEDVQEA